MKTIIRFTHLSGATLARVTAGLLLAASFSSQGQGTLTITFSQPPLPLDYSNHENSVDYVESGIRFTGEISRFMGPYFAFPFNNTAYLHKFPGQGVAFRSLDGSLLNLMSVDLAEFFRPNLTSIVRFIGYRPDGSFVTDEINTAGLRDADERPAFQTFSFRPDFTGFERVEISCADGYALDNLVIAVPEPGACVLVLLGGGLVALRGLRPRACEGKKTVSATTI